MCLHSSSKVNCANLAKDLTYEVSRETPVAGKFKGECSIVLPAGGYFLVNGKRQDGRNVWYDVVVCIGADEYNMWINAQDLRDQEISVMGESVPEEESAPEEPLPESIQQVAISLDDDGSSRPGGSVVAQIPGADDVVYIVPMGRKYHREDCRMLKGEALPISRGEATGEGYTRCEVCKP